MIDSSWVDLVIHSLEVMVSEVTHFLEVMDGVAILIMADGEVMVSEAGEVPHHVQVAIPIKCHSKIEPIS